MKRPDVSVLKLIPRVSGKIVRPIHDHNTFINVIQRNNAEGDDGGKEPQSPLGRR